MLCWTMASTSVASGDALIRPLACELRVAEFDCGEELDANAPEGLMDVGVNDITFWCPGVDGNVAMLQPSFPQTDK